MNRLKPIGRHPLRNSLVPEQVCHETSDDLQTPLLRATSDTKTVLVTRESGTLGTARADAPSSSDSVRRRHELGREGHPRCDPTLRDAPKRRYTPID